MYSEIPNGFLTEIPTNWLEINWNILIKRDQLATGQEGMAREKLTHKYHLPNVLLKATDEWQAVHAWLPLGDSWMTTRVVLPQEARPLTPCRVHASSLLSAAAPDVCIGHTCTRNITHSYAVLHHIICPAPPAHRTCLALASAVV